MGSHKRYTNSLDCLVDIYEMLARDCVKTIDQIDLKSRENTADVKRIINDFPVHLDARKIASELHCTEATHILADACIKGAAIIKLDTKGWASYSLNPDSDPHDIMLRIILDHVFLKTPSSTVCMEYLYNNPNITEEFVEDSIYVSSLLFTFDRWDDEAVNTVCDAAINAYDNVEDTERMLNDEFGEEFVKQRFQRIRTSVNGRPNVEIKFPIKESCVQWKPWFKMKYEKYMNKFVPVMSPGEDDDFE